jgi:serine kinase of HPr protein (carbohydrate metabolism regulator)
LKVTVKDLAAKLSLKALNDVTDTEVEGAFISDMLSDVMAGAKAGNVWVTVQTHKNVIAAANLVDVPAIIIVRNKTVPEDTIQMADRVGVTVFTTELDTFQVAVKLFEAGIKPTT